MMRKNSIFYDVHCHAMNLSHVGLLAFINRFFLDNALTFSNLLNGNFLKILCRRIFLPKSGEKWFKNLLQYVIAAFSILLFFTVIFSTLLVIVIYLFGLSRYILHFYVFQAVAFGSLIVLGIVFMLMILLWPLMRRKFSANIRRIINLLSVMENDMGSLFLYIEKDILSMDKSLQSELEKASRIRGAGQKGEWSGIFRVNGREYNKVVLTPLMMDFGYKGFKGIPQIHYNQPPRKPIVEQIVDVYNGIKDYIRRSPFQILEIYPFLGINTQNYDLGIVRKLSDNADSRLNDSLQNLSQRFKNKVAYIKQTGKLVVYEKILDAERQEWLGSLDREEDKQARAIIDEVVKKSQESDFAGKNNIPKMLRKYFGEYSGNYDDFAQNYARNFAPGGGIYKGDIEEISSHFFAGIKLYPPLGFDPWPDARQSSTDRPDEFDKVNYLYQFCSERRVPITVHCNNGGFVACKEYLEYTNPEKWEKVLSVYNDLKINLAHLGINSIHNDKKGTWTRTILKLVTKYKNVYADFSNIGVDGEFYNEILKKWISTWPNDEREKLENRILFGSDFMVDLFVIESYHKYLSLFCDSPLTEAQKHKFCSENPENFLFGRVKE